jgi:futalosine hydrolase
MVIVIVAATPFEIAPLKTWLDEQFQRKTENVYQAGSLTVQLLITGVGVTATAFQLGWMLSREKPDWVINAGIAGAFSPNLPLGTVVQVIQERFGDLGVEEADGSFTDVEELGLWPYAVMSNPHPPLPSLRTCNGLTVHKVHGSTASIQLIRSKYPDAEVESMEGAAFFYACLAAGTPFAEIRSISNLVEPRNREAWDLPLAINNLNKVLIQILEAIQQ